MITGTPEERIAELERTVGDILNLLHFVITDPQSMLQEPLRAKLWKIIDAILAFQNGVR